MMTVEFLNANVEIVPAKGRQFRVNNRTKVAYSRGYAFYVPGHGFIRLGLDPCPYVMKRQILESILNAGGFVSMEGISFIQAC